MRGFLLKVGLYVVLLLGAHLVAGYFADGFTDAYYLRFTGERQQNLIIGTSRAAQGIRPEFISGYEGEFYNYAFTLGHSPYGEVYRQSIEKKASATMNGKYIVTVDPWSISAIASDPNDESNFKEGEREVGKTSCVDCTPNYEYLLENYPNGWGKLILRRIKKNPSIHDLHDNGWLEIELPMDEQNIRTRTNRKLREYKKNLKTYAPSQRRLAGLKNTISMLDIQGDIYLVRLPIPDKMKEMEKTLMPEFDSLMIDLAKEEGIPYFDMTLLPDTFRYIDGNHLYRESSASVSKLIGEFISINEN